MRRGLWLMTRVILCVVLGRVSTNVQALSLMQSRRRISVALQFSSRKDSDSSDPSNSSANKPSSSSSPNLSASQRARREESKRRRERSSEVVIGKTSALPDATDYAMDVQKTQSEYLQQASRVEQIVFQQTEQGMNALRMLDITAADKAFEKVFAVKPNAYLWHAGIVKYYQHDYAKAAEIFARNAQVYESKFGLPATEERIWRYACELKYLSTMSRKERKQVLETRQQKQQAAAANDDDSETVTNDWNLLTPIPEDEQTAELLRSETRKVLRTTLELFGALVENDHANIILSRARLRSIGGALHPTPADQRGKRRAPPPVLMDRKMWKLNSWYYLGLQYDALGDEIESKNCMKQALLLCPSSGNGSDIVHTLPMLHMSERGWFDDEPFEEMTDDHHHDFASQESSDTASKSKGDPTTKDTITIRGFNIDEDPILVASIRSSLEKLRIVDLQQALKLRGLRWTGSKEELQERLFLSLMEDAGLIR